MNYNDVVNKAKELGAKRVEIVINWTWAYDFPTKEAGEAFVKWCDENGIENRGFYPGYPNSTNPNLHVNGVRFRR